jgi:hypothetical protein
MNRCCIDKSSSAELSEAINSIFRWYQKATVCYVYLADVSRDMIQPNGFDHSEIAQSRWFTRGWTLQETCSTPQPHPLLKGVAHDLDEKQHVRFHSRSHEN